MQEDFQPSELKRKSIRWGIKNLGRWCGIIKIAAQDLRRVGKTKSKKHGLLRPIHTGTEKLPENMAQDYPNKGSQRKSPNKPCSLQNILAIARPRSLWLGCFQHTRDSRPLVSLEVNKMFEAIYSPPLKYCALRLVMDIQ